jgi:hypothetical protein
MAIRKPLVLSNSGDIEQLQSGDSISNPATITLTNGESSVAMTAGMISYMTGTADSVKRAIASGMSTGRAFAFCTSTSISAGSMGQFQADGVITLSSTTLWDAVVTGGSGGLTSGAPYYVDPSTAGFITATAPSTTGQVVQKVGTAMDTLSLKIDFGAGPILL